MTDPIRAALERLIAKIKETHNPDDPVPGWFDSYFAARAALAEPLPPRAVPVSERLPEPNTKVLAHYFNDLGNGRTICAIWVPAKSWSDDIDDNYNNSDHLEYDETDDCYYWPEGWYETIENWDELGYVKVNEGDVIYWQPLPTWPANPTTTGNK